MIPDPKYCHKCWKLIGSKTGWTIIQEASTDFIIEADCNNC